MFGQRKRQIGQVSVVEYGSSRLSLSLQVLCQCGEDSRNAVLVIGREQKDLVASHGL